MADAQDSKSCGGDFVWVQVPLSAFKNPVKSRGLAIRDIYFSYYFCYYGFVRSKCFFFYTLPAHSMNLLFSSIELTSYV